MDARQSIWFRGKDIAQILGYVNTDKAIQQHVDEKYKKSYPTKWAVRSDTNFLYQNLVFTPL